jgi:hypothetical protein
MKILPNTNLKVNTMLGKTNTTYCSQILYIDQKRKWINVVTLSINSKHKMFKNIFTFILYQNTFSNKKHINKHNLFLIKN